MSSVVANFSLWGLFFLTTVYGHLGLRVAMKGALSTEYFTRLINPWGLSSFLAWGVSGILWAVILADRELVSANSVSAFRFVLISIFSCFLLSEKMSLSEVIGAILIVVGIYIGTRG